MRFLVTGAAGMLGRDVMRAATGAGHEAVGFARTALDVTDAGAVERAIAAAAPDVVVNCAAYTDVDGAESNEDAAALLNGVAAGLVAAAARAAGARVVQVSTDYVFDGTATRPYVESDPVAPRSAYGRTKLAGERAVAAAHDDHQIVRTAWLFGRGGANFVQTMLRLGAERDEVSVVTDQIGSPTYTGHLADGLVRLAAEGGPGIHHLAGAGACSWHELTVETFRQARIECRVLQTTTASFPRPAPRPAYSVLGSERTDSGRLAHWKEGLATYLAEAP
jgi:dTDP-4-dehydrorhamnose reductase